MGWLKTIIEIWVWVAAISIAAFAVSATAKSIQETWKKKP